MCVCFFVSLYVSHDASPAFLNIGPLSDCWLVVGVEIAFMVIGLRKQAVWEQGEDRCFPWVWHEVWELGFIVFHKE